MGAGKVFSDELIQDVERNHGLLAATVNVVLYDRMIKRRR